MPSDEPDDVLYVQTGPQLRAISNLVRHRVVAALREEPATITQLAERLGLAKGSSSYHVRVLEQAGLITVVRTRKVRGVVERYYAPTSRTLRLPDPAPGQRDVLLGHAVAELAAAPPDRPRTVRMARTRLSPERYREFTERLEALMDELVEARDPGQPEATMAVAFFLPGETERR